MGREKGRSETTTSPPPDKQEKATQAVLEQAEALSEMWAVVTVAD